MIQFLNNLINKILIGLKYLAFAVIVAIWIVAYPFNRAIYQISKRKYPYPFYNHPNFILLNWIMKINKYFNKFIF